MDAERVEAAEIQMNKEEVITPLSKEPEEEAAEEKPEPQPWSPPEALFEFPSMALKGAPYKTWITDFAVDLVEGEIHRRGRTVGYDLSAGPDEAVVIVPSRIQPMRGLDLATLLDRYSKAVVKVLKPGDEYLNFSDAHVNPGEEKVQGEGEEAVTEGMRAFSYTIEGAEVAVVAEEVAVEEADEAEESAD